MIKPSKDLVKTLDVLPILADKFVVDFVNGIHVTNDHIRCQKLRTSFSARLIDGFTGVGKARQIEINANLANGVESSLRWLGELSESLAQSNYAIACVNNRLNDLKKDAAEIANYSADTRELLYKLSDQIAKRCNYLENEISRIDFVQRVQINIDHVFSRWSAGKYQDLSLANRCYAALEELNWGAFGDFYRSDTSSRVKQDFIEIAKNNIIDCLCKDTEAEYRKRFEVSYWLNTPKNLDSLNLLEAMEYLGKESNEKKQPFIYTATQQPKNIPIMIPIMCSAERLGESMIHEIFDEVEYV